MKKFGKLIALILTCAAILLAFVGCGEPEKERIAFIKGLGDIYEAYGLSLDADYYYAKMTVKDYGEVILKLDAKNAPVTAGNFIGLVSEGFYDGLTFHRAMYDFMIQGGDPKADGTGDSGSTIVGEFAANGYNNPISHNRGVLSMARGNAVNSASCQFFICNGDSTFLDGSYAAFGYVVEGMEIVDAITEAMAPFGDATGAVADKTKHVQIEKITMLADYKG